MAHEHRLTLDADGFRALVAGKPVTADCACGDPVAVVLQDIGYLTMTACIQAALHARAARDPARGAARTAARKPRGDHP